MGNNEFVSFVLKLLIFFWILTPLISTLIIFCPKLFEKADLSKVYAYIPILNLVYLNKIAELPSASLLLYFLPIVNLIYFYYVLYKISIFFNTSKSFYLGLVLLPLFFVPILALGNYKYKEEEKKKQKLMEDVKDYSFNLLTQEEIDNMNNTKIKEKKIDSLYKSNWDTKEEPDAYKASKVNVDNKFSEVEVFDEPRVKKVKPTFFEPVPEKQKKEKKSDIETLDL